jgi:hypothetical protein
MNDLDNLDRELMTETESDDGLQDDELDTVTGGIYFEAGWTPTG